MCQVGVYKRGNIIGKCVLCMKSRTYAEKMRETIIAIKINKPFEIILIMNSEKTKFMVGIIDHFRKMASLIVTSTQDEQMS